MINWKIFLEKALKPTFELMFTKNTREYFIDYEITCLEYVDVENFSEVTWQSMPKHFPYNPMNDKLEEVNVYEWNGKSAL